MRKSECKVEHFSKQGEKIESVKLRRRRIKKRIKGNEKITILEQERDMYNIPSGHIEVRVKGTKQKREEREVIKERNRKSKREKRKLTKE